MEKQRMKQIFENLKNFNSSGKRSDSSSQENDCAAIKKVFIGPKRRVCRKLVFNSPSPACSSETSPANKESFDGSTLDTWATDDILPIVELKDNSLQSTSAADEVFCKINAKSSQKNVLKFPITTRIYRNIDESTQVNSLKSPATGIVILSDILLPKTNVNMETLEAIGTTATSEKATLSVQKHSPQMSPPNFDKMPSENKLESNSSHVPVALVADPATSLAIESQNQFSHTSLITTSINNTSTTPRHSLICKIDLSRLVCIKNIKLSKILPLNSPGFCASNTNDSHTTSTMPTNNSSQNTLRTNDKHYQISPINSNESDPDLSDLDPTYHTGIEDTVSRPTLSLLSRQSRRLSSSSSSGSSNSGTSSSGSSSETSADSSISPIRKTRKRKREPESWKFNTAKRLRNTGQSYLSVRTKKAVDARKVKPPCSEKCRLKCFSKFTEQERKTYFDKYWNLRDINIQRAYIKSCMVEIKPKYKYSKNENPRKSNYAFYLNRSNTKERVCKTFFINTFDITDRMIRTVKEKCDEHNFLSEDKRGKHGNHKKILDTLVSDIKSFIASIPRVESHYTRATSSCEYISPGRTLTEIYQDFVELQQKNGRSSGKFCNFYGIFKDTGIKIHQPKKDLCDLCRDYKLTPNEDLKQEYDRHIEEKDLSRKEKKEDRYAINENKIVAVYDLEAILQVPQGKSSSLYYKTKMNCYNFTIAELAKKNPTEEDSNKAYTNVFSYFWDETQGQKGSIEIATCVHMFLRLVNERSTSKSVDVIFYSDNTFSQNKNKYITTLYMYALTQFENINSIRHKYLIKGHTQNENDNAHSLIEKEIQKYIKADTIYTPIQYIPLIKSAKKTGKKFEVQTLTFDDFIDIKDLQSQWGLNFNKDTNRNPIVWNDVKILEFRKNEPFKFYFKTSYKDQEYREVDVRMRKALPLVNDIVLGKAYKERFHLNDNKKRDIKNLIIKKVIPPYYASYYKDLV